MTEAAWKFVPLNEISSADWDNLISEYPTTTLFHTSSWIELIEKTFDVRKLLLSIYRNNDLIGVLPGFVSQKGPFRIYGTPLKQIATLYQGPLLKKDEDLCQCIEKAWTYLRSEFNIDYIDINLQEIPAEELNILEKDKWHIEFKKTLILNLQEDEELIWRRIQSKTRTEIRKALREGARVVEIDPKVENIVDEFYQMLVEVFKRHGISPKLPRQFYENLFSQGDKFIKLFGVKKNGCWVAISLFLYYQRWAHCLNAVSYREACNKLSINKLIQWEFIKWACNNGLKKYDKGAGVGQLQGIYQFKSCFRPDESFHLNLWNGTPLASMSRKAYQRAFHTLKKMEFRLKRRR